MGTVQERMKDAGKTFAIVELLAGEQIQLVREREGFARPACGRDPAEKMAAPPNPMQAGKRVYFPERLRVTHGTD